MKYASNLVTFIGMIYESELYVLDQKVGMTQLKELFKMSSRYRYDMDLWSFRLFDEEIDASDFSEIF